MKRRNSRGWREVYGQEEGEGGGERTLVVHGVYVCTRLCIPVYVSAD